MDNKKYITRLHRIEGQLRGIERMWQDDRELISIVQQLDAAKSALSKLIANILVEDILGFSEQLKKIPSKDLTYLKRYLEKQN